MLDYVDMIYYMNLLDKEWGAAGRKVVELVWHEEEAHLNMSCADFLQLCTACGGNWGGMLLSGIKRVCPKVWEAIPENMGDNAWGCICATLALMGVSF